MPAHVVVASRKRDKHRYSSDSPCGQRISVRPDSVYVMIFPRSVVADTVGVPATDRERQRWYREPTPVPPPTPVPARVDPWTLAALPQRELALDALELAPPWQVEREEEHDGRHTMEAIEGQPRTIGGKRGGQRDRMDVTDDVP
jgi:hypothetical protein